jgi:hypothetical protein
MKQFILISIILLSIQVVYAQTEEKRGLQCDSIIFMDGTAKLVQVKEVNRRKIIYILCCYDCAVPRKFKKNEIDTIIYFQEGWVDHQTQYLDSLEQHKEAIPSQVVSTSAKINKNTLFVNASPLLLNNTINVNYERILIGNDNVSAFAKVGIGGFINIYGSGGYTMAKLGLLTGKNKHHFELSAGGLLDIPKIGWGDRPLYYPYAVNIGWRVQDPNKNFIFKLGIGLPEFLYFGLGFSF